MVYKDDLASLRWTRGHPMVINRGRGRGGGSGRGGRDKVKPKRGGPRHFTVHPRDIYMKEGQSDHSGDESSDCSTVYQDKIIFFHHLITSIDVRG